MVVLRINPGIASLKPMAFWALAIALSAVPIRAQKGTPPSSGTGGSRGPTGGTPPARSGGPTFEAAIPTQPGAGGFIPNMQPSPKRAGVVDEEVVPLALLRIREAT